MDVKNTTYEDIKPVFQAAYHNDLFDGSIARSGISTRKVPIFMSRAHIQAFFDENPYVMTRVGEYIHFYVVSMRLDNSYDHKGFRVKESDLFDGEVEKIEWGVCHPWCDLFSEEYSWISAKYLAVYTDLTVFLKK